MLWSGTAFYLGWCFLELCLRTSCSHVFPVTCSDTTVKLASRGHEEVVIVGIDEYGYLRVQCKSFCNSHYYPQSRVQKSKPSISATMTPILYSNVQTPSSKLTISIKFQKNTYQVKKSTYQSSTIIMTTTRLSAYQKTCSLCSYSIPHQNLLVCHPTSSFRSCPVHP